MSKVYVVTGGGSGIGKAIAASLPTDGIVVITGRNLSKLEKTIEGLKENGGQFVATTCDVSNRADVRKLAEYCASLGEVSKVFHCAGVSGTMANPETIIKINGLGTVYVNQEFYKVMNGGVICDIASNSGYILPSLLLPSKKVYALCLSDEAKFIEKMTKKVSMSKKDQNANCQTAYLTSKNFARWYSSNCAYKYMATKGIRVFSISPGFVKTPMTEAEGGDATDTFLTYTGTNRGAEPAEIAFLAISLADDRCSYVVGADVLADGGVIANGYGALTATKKYDGKAAKENW